MIRLAFLALSASSVIVIAALAQLTPYAWWALLVVAPLIGLGLVDMTQREHAIRRNFPLVGHGRYILEAIRPEIMQYFIEQNHDGRPVNRELRSLVYQRAKGELDTLPFGTQRDVYEPGYEWMDHSLNAHLVAHDFVPPRVRIGGPHCTQPYDASVLNISAMSYGSLSSRAVLALNGGAREGGFFHNTGEGGVSPYHLEPGGDLCWQIGTGYFGCRAADGGFDPESFRAKATLPQIKLIEVKLSQGAKPGHGGILPAGKVTEEISQIRGVPMGQDVLSPPGHRAFNTPVGLLEFCHQLRTLSGGKPVGFKLCVGHHHEFLAICKAMVDTGLTPDFIAVDGGEGGTGAAPLEFSNRVGAPLTDGLIFVHNALTGFGLRGDIKIIASGKILSGFHIAQRLALGADLCNSARGMMFALGCIQALRCNSNHCPTGVATQDPGLVVGLDVAHKTARTAQYHKETVLAFYELIGAAGLHDPDDLRPHHVHRRINRHVVRDYSQLYDWLTPGELLGDDVPQAWRPALARAQAGSFTAAA